MELKLANHCNICKYYKSSQGSSMKCQDELCMLHNFKTHNRYICDKFEIANNQSVTKLTNNINKYYGITREV